MCDGVNAAIQDVGVAVVGAGWAAEKYLHALSRLGVTVRAVCSRSSERATAVASRFGFPDAVVTDDLEAALHCPGVDVVVIASPSHLHAGQTISAAREGKHVVVEKPVALAQSDFDDVVHEISSRGVLSATGFVQRAGLYQRRVKQCVVDGYVGDPFYVDVGYVSYQPQSAFDERSWMRSSDLAGDSFLLTGIHSVDSARWLASTDAEGDLDVVEVHAFDAHTRPEMDYPDFAAAQLMFANGTVGTVTSHLSGRGRHNPPLSIFGREGTIRGDRLWSERLAKLQGWLELGVPHPAQEGHPLLYQRHMAEFLGDLVAGRQHRSAVPVTANTHATCFAIGESLHTGGRVAVNRQSDGAA